MNILKIIRDKSTNGEIIKKYNISHAQCFAIKDASKYLTIKEIEDRIHLIQPWMLAEDIQKIMDYPQEEIDKIESQVNKLRKIFGL